MRSNIDKFKNRMASHGLPCPDEILADGEPHYFYVMCESDQEQACYIFCPEKPSAGVFGVLGDKDSIKKWSVKALGEATQAKLVIKIGDMKKRLQQALLDAQKPRQDELSSSIPSEHSVFEGLDEGDRKAIINLAALSPFDYDRVRKQEATKLSIRLMTLDKRVAKLRRLLLAISVQGPKLMKDISDIFEITEKRISTEALILNLSNKDKIWSDYNNGKPIHPKQLASILELYGIESRDIRFDDRILKGYSRDMFESLI
ncbi:DUF3631 domain-containing protein [Geobacter pelophilus]|uniref:DUF3631 domain-containing protein n=1 Tax=Geoanaerobacter pelophilus TaxID=60036 RepID=A0AAW4L669_9BACT|nr:DUF3631 domain-containing protein [Geoanaerobacter pelophilus]MBT0664523.1 DUF3631 domain-containing protein [Geoanaerobacter pelophilus]